MNPDEYLAEVRKWPRRPSDYDSQTESIIRRLLSPSTSIADISEAIQRGQLEVTTEAHQRAPDPKVDSGNAQDGSDKRETA